MTFAAQNLKPASVKRYRETIKIYIEPALGGELVSTLSAYKVQEQYSKWLASGISPQTVYRCHTVLSGAFKRAARWQLVPHNIIRDVEPPHVPQTEVMVFDPSEVDSILSVALSQPLHAVFVLALCTGMRGGEILALQPADYNKQDGTLSIRRTLVNNGTAIGPPKSKNSYRTIALPRIAIEALERVDMSGKWLFPSKAGTTMFYHNYLRFHWYPLLKRAGVRRMHMHTCRHYFVSSLIKQGLPITAIARYVGDHELSLMRTYAHLINGMESMVPNAVDAIHGA